MLLGLPFGGQIVTGPPNLSWNNCAQLMGITPPAHKTDGFTLSLAWLKENLVDNDFNEQSPPEVKIQHTRRYPTIPNWRVLVSRYNWIICAQLLVVFVKGF